VLWKTGLILTGLCTLSPCSPFYDFMSSCNTKVNFHVDGQPTFPFLLFFPRIFSIFAALLFYWRGWDSDFQPLLVNLLKELFGFSFSRLQLLSFVVEEVIPFWFLVGVLRFFSFRM